MEVTETAADGLKREYKIIVQADEIEGRVSDRLKELSRTIRMPGFRPGKVPVSLLRKQYGRSVMGEVVEQAVNQGSQQAISDNELRPALRPKIEVTSFDEGADLEFTMAVEVLPEVPKLDLKAISLSRPVAEVDDEAVDKTLTNMAERMRDFEPVDRASQDGDRITIDFEGKVDGELFDGGKADDFPLVLGSASMIPGFEDQLIGKQAGDHVAVQVSFPEAYASQTLAGKPATFEVDVKEVAEPKPAVIDDELAKRQGLDDLDALKKAVQDSMENEYKRISRLRAKRSLLDHLAETCKFDVPAGMVDLEFNQIWEQVKRETAAEKGEESDEAPEPDEELKGEYQDIAERRVRLGLILSDIGQANDLQVEQTEINQAVLERARSFPGQEQQVVDFYKKTPQAVEQLRAPIYEDKVVNFILEASNVTDQTVTPEELMKEPEDEEVGGAAVDDVALSSGSKDADDAAEPRSN